MHEISNNVVYATIKASDQPARTCSLIRAFASRLCIVKPLTENYLEFLSLKEGCTGSSESTLVKMPHCRKSHVRTQNDSVKKYAVIKSVIIKSFHCFKLKLSISR